MSPMLVANPNKQELKRKKNSFKTTNYLICCLPLLEPVVKKKMKNLFRYKLKNLTCSPIKPACQVDPQQELLS